MPNYRDCNNQIKRITYETGFLSLYAQRNVFEILSNQPEIRLYLPFTDWFGSKRTSAWIYSSRKMVNTVRFRVYSLRFRQDFCVCIYLAHTSRTTRPQATLLSINWTPSCMSSNSRYSSICWFHRHTQYVNLNQLWIVIMLLRLIWLQTEYLLMLNLFEWWE